MAIGGSAVGAASLWQRPEGNFQAPEERHILDLASEDVAPDGAGSAGALQLQRCRAHGAEIGHRHICPQGHAALSRSTFLKPPALPEVADWHLHLACAFLQTVDDTRR